MQDHNDLTTTGRLLAASVAAALAVFTPAASSARAQEATRVQGVVHQGVSPSTVTNLAYGPLPAQILDLTMPSSAYSLPRPVIVLIHGGGYTSGDKAGYQPTFVPMMADAGYIVANIDYRLSNGGPTVEMINDVQLAIRWLKANANNLGVAPGRICLNGFSAGGTLAVAAGSLHTIFPGDMADQLPSVPVDVRCVMDNSGPVTLSLDGTNQSVLSMVTAAAPPMIVTHGINDPVVPIQEAYAIVAKLRQDGRPVKAIYYDAGHVMSGLSSQAKDAIYNLEVLFAVPMLSP